MVVLFDWAVKGPGRQFSVWFGVVGGQMAMKPMGGLKYPLIWQMWVSPIRKSKKFAGGGGGAGLGAGRVDFSLTQEKSKERQRQVSAVVVTCVTNSLPRSALGTLEA